MSTLFALIAIGCVALWSIIATVEMVSRDGYGPAPLDPNYGSAANERAAFAPSCGSRLRRVS